MGVWIVVITVLFLLGSFMALKPNGVDVRLDKLRMTARRYELNPKVVACPAWIRGRDNELGRGMIGQYALVLDKNKFAESYYEVINNRLQTVSVDMEKLNDTHSVTGVASRHMLTDHTLNGQCIDLPDSIAPFIKGVYCKANCVVVFWSEADYVKPLSNPNFDNNNIEPDLKALKSRMEYWSTLY